MTSHSISSETAIWITINAILLTMLITLTIRLIRSRRRKRDEEYFVASYGWSDMLDRMLGNEGNSESIKRLFNIVVEDLAKTFGLNLKRSLTMREVVNKISLSLPPEQRKHLIQLYQIYEAARFGGMEPSVEQVNVFRRSLALLEDAIGFRVRRG